MASAFLGKHLALYLGTAWNAIIQGAFDRSTAGPSVWVGESGVLTAGVLVLFAVVLYKLWPLAQRASLSPSSKTLSQQYL